METIEAPAKVLILIVMEDTLRDMDIQFFKIKKDSLNPYCNGRYSTSISEIEKALKLTPS